MKKYLSIVLLVGFWSCGLQYAIVDKVDPYTKSHIIREKMNRLGGLTGSIELNMIYDKNSKSKFIGFHYRDSDWLFIKQSNSFRFLFDNGDVLTMSVAGNINENVDSGGGVVLVEEWGTIIPSESELNKLINEKIVGLRVEGKSSLREYNMGTQKLQSRWMEFSKLYFSES